MQSTSAKNPLRRLIGHESKIGLRLCLAVIAGFLIGLSTSVFPVLFSASALILVGAITALYFAYLWPELFLTLALWTYFLKFAFIFSILGLGITPFMIFLGLTLAGYGLRYLGGEHFLRLPPGAFFFVLLVGFTALSLLPAQNPESVIGPFFRTVLDWILMLMLIQAFTDRHKLKRIILVLLIQAFVFILWGLISALLARASGSLLLTSYDSFFWNQLRKNDYAVYLAFASLLSIAVITHLRDTLNRALANTILIVAPLAWFLTRSRSGLLAIMISIVLFLLLERNTKLLKVLALLALFAAISFAVFPSQERDILVDGFRALLDPGSAVYARNTYTVNVRLELMALGSEVFVEHPFMGVGFNQWQFFSPGGNYRRDARTGELVFIPLEIHNRHLQLATSSGIFALIGYLGFVTVLLWRAWRARAVSGPLLRALLNLMIAFVVAAQITMTVLTGIQWEWPALGVLAGLINLAENKMADGLGIHGRTRHGWPIEGRNHVDRLQDMSSTRAGESGLSPDFP